VLQQVVSQGTGKQAQISGFAAGKTGTTENYGDAWFVGWNQDMTVAVWVGYPDRLRPMRTEYGGSPVAGGTFPASIWHDFMTSAMAILQQRVDTKAAGAAGASGNPDQSTQSSGDASSSATDRGAAGGAADQAQTVGEPNPAPAPQENSQPSQGQGDTGAGGAGTDASGGSGPTG
jgi:penicillin-binding protein 1A